MIKQYVFPTLMAGACAAAMIATNAPAQVQPGDSSDSAARFGSREDIEDISLSPDAKHLAFVMPNTGRGNKLYVVATDGGTPTPVLNATGTPEHITNCGWVSNQRLLCNIIIVNQEVAGPVVLSRMVAIDSNGGNLKLVSKREGSDAHGRAYFGGSVVAWLPDADGSVLVSRTYVPESKIGSNIANPREGLGVDRIDTNSLAAKPVERPKPGATEYIGDGEGTVRILGITPVNSDGYQSQRTLYSYRKPGSRTWESLGTYDVLTGEGFDPYAVDAKLNVAYGFRKKDGRKGLYKVALDGTLAQTPVFVNDEVDVDGLIRVGRSRRVVGATYATDKRQAVYFDPELAKLSQSLGKALPGKPLVQFAGASGDESKLLVWAGSDTDPGRYYLLDRATKRMAALLPSRSQLEGVKLAPVKPISYRAADGTMIPGYLTLPPDSQGKKIPAIVMPHGGPGARDEWGFDWLAQFYANRGYAVLQPNFRGSSGYGDAWFQRNGFQSWRIAVGDVTDGGRWLVSEGIADPSKMAIVGWSYGGYAALQSAVVAPSLFKAVVAIAPVTDLAQLKADALAYSTGYLQQDFIGSGPHVREGSPAQNASEIKVPVMLFHGDLDSNVPVAQSRLMKSKLERAGTKNEFILYRGLDHQLNDSTARADMLRKSDQFIRTAIGM